MVFNPDHFECRRLGMSRIEANGREYKETIQHTNSL